MLKVLAVFLVIAALSHGYKTYKGYKLVQLRPANEKHFSLVENLEAELGFELDFWKRGRALNRHSDVMVDPEHADKFLGYLNDNEIPHKVLQEDLSELVALSMSEVRPSSFIGDDPNQFPLNQYHSHDDINAYLRAVANTYRSFVTLNTLGKTHQNRDMLYIKIGTPAPAGQTKNALWIDAGIHAREWVAPATAIYVINQLTNGYSGQYRQLLDAIDIYVAPSINPDGYEYSRNNDRMWRKTRTGPRSGCYGVDPNRNWNFHWAGAGTSGNPCSNIYRGPSAFSEPCCMNVRNFLVANSGTIKGYLTLHSYGEDWIYPWGYASHTYTPDRQQLQTLGMQARAAIQAVHGTRYTVGNSADDLYPAAGASDDYSKHIGIKWVYTVELRPGDGDTDNDHSYGFALPAQFILPTATEAFQGFLVVANRIRTGPN